MRDMDKLRAELTRITKEHDGVLRPDDVVREAENPASPLHSSFEWDDGVAAHAWRLEQARTLIRSVRITVETSVMPRSLAPVFVHDHTQEDGKGYVPLASIRSDRARARAVMLDEITRVESALARAESVAEVLKLKDELTSVKARVGKLRKLVPAE